MLRLVLFQYLDGGVVDGDVGFALRPREAEGGHLLPTFHERDRSLLRIQVAHVGDVGQLDRAPVTDRDAGFAQLMRAGRVAEDANRLLGAGDLRSSAETGRASFRERVCQYG